MKIALLLLFTVVLTLGLTPAFAGSSSDRTLNPEWTKCARSIGDYGYGAEVFCAKKGIDKYISKKQSTTSYSVRNIWESSAKSNYAWNNWDNMPTKEYIPQGHSTPAVVSNYAWNNWDNMPIVKSYTIPEIKPAPQIYKSPEYTKPIQENFGKTIYQDSQSSWYNSWGSNFGPGISEWPTANTWGNCGWVWCR